MLTPSYLSRKLKTPTHVGIFFHTPFPSSDVFRILPCSFGRRESRAGRDSFLHSLLSVNHLGFHLYEYLRHFANAVRRMLGVQLQTGDRGQMFFDYNGRHVLASSSFMSIEPNVMKDCLATDEFQRERAHLLDVMAGRRAVVSVCYLERLKGLPLQLQAINSLLESSPSLASSVVFLLVLTIVLADV